MNQPLGTDQGNGTATSRRPAIIPLNDGQVRICLYVSLALCDPNSDYHKLSNLPRYLILLTQTPHTIRTIINVIVSARWALLLPVASLTKEANSRLAKRPLVFNGRLANRGPTSPAKEATGSL